MPKLTKQAYISKGVKQVNLPSERLIGWALRRFVQLKLRFRIKVNDWRRGQLKQKLNDYFNSLADTAEGVEGRYFWVADYNTPHMGPCLFCEEQEAKFRNTGAPMDFLLQIKGSQPSLSWHWNSRRGPGITYSRILNEAEANKFGIGQFGSQSPQGAEGETAGFVLTEKMRKDLAAICTQHVSESTAMATQLAQQQLGQEALQRKAGGRDVGGIENIGIA